MSRKRCLAACVVLTSLTLTGCTFDWFRRSSDKKELAAPRMPELKIVGDYTSFVGIEPIQVHGVGVVQGLKGTGSNPPPGPMRQQALHDLKRMGVEKPDEFLALPTTAVVLVTAYIPPGARKEDRLDVEVQLPAEDKSTSLRGGELICCDLFEYVDGNAMRGRQEEGQRLLPHHKMAKAEGPLMLGFEADGQGATKERKARVWGGARILKERSFDIILNKENQSAGIAMGITKAINDRFHSADGTGRRVVAEAMNSQHVVLKMPDHYRLNWPRYLRVVRAVPLGQNRQMNQALIDRLGQDLMEADRAVDAALQLEALGQDSIPRLKQALQAVHPLSRFCAAESLAYLGDPACGEPLAALIREYPEFRAFGLTALASLNEAVCHIKLRELLHETEPEVRYGAFRALRILNERDAHIQGVRMGDFWLHRLPSRTPGLVHISTGQRAEVIIYGDEPRLEAPFSFRAGDFVITAKEGDSKCLVSRYSLHAERDQNEAPLTLTEIIVTLGKMGAGYSDVVDFLNDADRCKSLSCKYAVDALPQARPLERLALARSTGKGGSDLGDTPNLFTNVAKLWVKPEKSPAE